MTYFAKKPCTVASSQKKGDFSEPICVVLVHTWCAKKPCTVALCAGTRPFFRRQSRHVSFWSKCRVPLWGALKAYRVEAEKWAKMAIFAIFGHFLAGQKVGATLGSRLFAKSFAFCEISSRRVWEKFFRSKKLTFDRC